VSEPAQQRWVRRLVGYVMRRRRDVAVALFAAVLGAACQAGAPLLERQIVDGVIVERSESLWPWLIALVLVGAGAFLGAHLRRYRGGKVALGVQYDLRNEMQAHLSGWTSPTSTGCRPGSSSPAPAPTPPSSRAS